MDRLPMALLTVACAASTLRAAEPMLVADLVPGEVVEDGLRDFPDPAVRLGDGIFFTARSPAAGFELWRSDGTETGTAVVRDLCPGPCDASPRQLTAAGDAVYFVADDAGEPRLFRSDGTRAGTLPVLGSCAGGRCFSSPRIVAAAGDRLTFVARGADGALALWTTDGSRTGTRAAAPPAGGCAIESVDEATAAADRLTLDVRCAGGGEALWAVDDAQAVELATGVDVWDLVPSDDGRVVFVRSPGGGGAELWATDGTPGGTGELGPPGGGCGPPAAILGVGSGGAAIVVTGERGFVLPLAPRCLWAVAPGDEPARLFGDGIARRAALELGVAADGDLFFFLAATPGGGPLEVELELWVSDGTPGGTRPLAPVAFPGPFATLGGHLVFADDGGLYRSDGTPAGTVRFAEGEMRRPSVVGDRLFFGRRDEAGLQPWLTDGTAAGTARLAVVGAGRAAGEPRAVTGLGKALLFSSGTTADAALWRADAGGVVRLSELPGGATELFVRGKRAIVGGPGFGLGPSLLATDGTPAGTEVLSTEGWSGRGFARFRGDFYFAASTPAQGFELWVSDGTAAGTGLFMETDPGIVQTDPPYPLQGDPSGLVALGKRLVFAAWSDGPGRELWASDGTAAGTDLVADLCPGECGSFPAELTRLPRASKRRRALFSATDGTSGRELWRTDGTAAGTRRLADLAPGAAGSAPHGLTAFGDRVFFIAASPNGGEALWRSTGTAAGTRLVAELSLGGEAGQTPRRPPDYPGAGDRATARSVVVAGGLMYFVVEHPATGAELWASDGTAAGTGLVRDIDPGPSSSSPSDLTEVDGRLVFAAEESVHGRELWVSDGSEAGTRLLADLAPGAASSSPAEIGVAAGLVGFRADDGVTGGELWAVARGAVAAGH